MRQHQMSVKPARRTYFATVMLGAHLDRLEPQHRDAFLDAVLAELPDPFHVDYVRLNILARRT